MRMYSSALNFIGSLERMARTRRAFMSTLRARRFRQWSLVSSHERGPPMATSMTRALLSAADIAEPLAGIDDFAGMACSMFKDMKRADTWKSIGTVAAQVAARLKLCRDKLQEKAHLNVPPSPANFDGADGAARDAIVGGNQMLRPSIRANRAHLVCRQSSVTVSLASRQDRPSLPVAIPIVVANRSEE